MSPSPVPREPSLRLRLFGPMEVRLPDGPLPRLRSRKGLWLLALLALRGGRAVERSWLAGTLWPECDEAHARRSLRQSLHDLRLALGPEVWRMGGESPRTLTLDLSGAFVDVLEFDAAVTDGARTSLQTAVDLYTGPLLEDCAEDWNLEERRRRELAYLGALTELARRASNDRDYAGAAAYLQLGVATDPFREDLQRDLMEALARAGNHAAALVVYRRLRELLGREMAAEPTEATTALFRRLRDEIRARGETGEEAGAGAVPTTLPQPLTCLIGREREIRQVAEELRASRLVTLTGSGGVGKTRLALEVARELATRLSGGVLFAPLALVAAGDRLEGAVSAAAGVRLAGVESGDDLVRLLNDGSPRLLVLDNCEHLRRECAQLLHRLLTGCPDLRVLATSRERLGVPGEIVWRVPSLPVPGGDMPLEASSAGRLFLDRARTALPGFELTPARRAAVIQICQRVEGIPLAIELAAARVRALPVEQIAARLGEGFQLLRGGEPAFPERHQTLAATFEWSWALLPLPEQMLLARLSAFRGGWTLEAAEAVCGRSPLSREAIPDLLTALVDKSLVVYDPGREDGEARYLLLEVIREHAAVQLRSAGEAEVTGAAHRDHFLVWAEEVKPRLWGSEQAAWFARLEAEHANLRTALAWCRRPGDLQQELRLVVALARFWDTHGHLREGRAFLEDALTRMDGETPAPLRAAVLVHAAWMAYAQGDFSAARGRYSAALELLRESGDRRTLSDVLNCFALATLDSGHLDEARELFEEALILCRELGGSTRLGSVLGNLGSLALRQGDRPRAREYLEQCASWCEFAGDAQLHGLAMHDLSLAAYQEGRLEEARARCADSLRLLHRSGAVVNIPGVLDQMARVAEGRDDMEAAARLAGAADGLRRILGVAPPAETPVRRSFELRSLNTAYREGRTLDLNAAVRCALEEADALSPAR